MAMEAEHPLEANRSRHRSVGKAQAVQSASLAMLDPLRDRIGCLLAKLTDPPEQSSSFYGMDGWSDAQPAKVSNIV